MKHLRYSKAISESAAAIGPNCTSSCLSFSVEWIAWSQSMPLTCLARRRRGHAACVVLQAPAAKPLFVATTVWRRSRRRPSAAARPPNLAPPCSLWRPRFSGISQPRVASFQAVFEAFDISTRFMALPLAASPRPWDFG